MCRALRVLCAAPDGERLLGSKRAAISVHWELVGGATSLDDLAAQVERLAPDIVVIDAEMGTDAVAAARAARPRARIVALGAAVEGADAWAGRGDLKDAILGVPPVGGPVRS